RPDAAASRPSGRDPPSSQLHCLLGAARACRAVQVSGPAGEPGTPAVRRASILRRQRVSEWPGRILEACTAPGPAPGVRRIGMTSRTTTHALMAFIAPVMFVTFPTVALAQSPPVTATSALVSVGSPPNQHPQNAQNEPALAVDASNTSVLAAGANDLVDM